VGFKDGVVVEVKRKRKRRTRGQDTRKDEQGKEGLYTLFWAEWA
jgi:hypothetical protein